MANVIFTADQSVFSLYVEAACHIYNYQTQIPDPDPTHPGQFIPNPQSPGEFAQSLIVKFAKDVTKAYQVTKASETARLAAIEAAKTAIDEAVVTSVLTP